MVGVRECGVTEGSSRCVTGWPGVTASQDGSGSWPVLQPPAEPALLADQRGVASRSAARSGQWRTAVGRGRDEGRSLQSRRSHRAAQEPVKARVPRQRLRDASVGKGIQRRLPHHQRNRPLADRAAAEVSQSSAFALRSFFSKIEAQKMQPSTILY